jgi:hypothetical protein
LNGENQLPNVIEGVKFIDGIEVIETPSENADQSITQIAC